MSLAATLHAFLALVPAKVLDEDIRLEVVIMNGQLEVNKAKLRRKVSLDLKQANSTSYN